MTALAPNPSAQSQTASDHSGGDQAARLRKLFAGELSSSPTPPSSQPQHASPPVSLTPVPVGPTAPMLTIASGKGGVGKTSLAVNLSIALAQLGCRPTLLDADIGTANADVLCGINPRARLDSLLNHQRTSNASQIALEAPGGFLLLPGAVGLTRLGHLSDADRDRVLRELVKVETRTDLFLIDAGAGVGRDVQTFVEASDAVVLVVTPEPTAIADAYALVKSVWARKRAALRETQANSPQAAPSQIQPTQPWWVVVNAAAHESEALATHHKLASCAQRFLGEHLSLLGWVHSDRRVAQAVRRRRPFMLGSRHSRPSREIRALAHSVLHLAQRMGPAPLPSLRSR